VASSEAEFPLEPRPRGGLGSRVGLLPSSEAVMERVAGGLGGVASSEAEMVPRVRVRPRMGRTAELGRGPCTDRASLGLGEDLGAVGELEELQDIRVQSDD